MALRIIPTQRVALNLGWVSLLNDLSSEAIWRLLPFYVTGALGAPMSVVGLIEGISDSTSTLLKPVFGRISDRLRKRRHFVFLGYAISNLSRPFLAFAGHWGVIAGLRFCDRLGKGIRSAPRDALLADWTFAQGEHGRAFGLNRAMDTAGALLGVLGTLFWLKGRGTGALDKETWKLLCLGLSLPAVVALAWVALTVRDAPKIAEKTAAGGSAPLPARLKRYLAIVAVFSLANSSDAFILLKIRELGYSLPGTLFFVSFSLLVSSATSLPAAILSDRLGRRSLIRLGWLIYAGCYLAFGLGFAAINTACLTLTLAVYGLFYGFTDGVERAWIAELAPPESRGRAYGAFGLVVGLSALPASVAFGSAWEHFGSRAPFLAAAALAALAAALLSSVVPPAGKGNAA